MLFFFFLASATPTLLTLGITCSDVYLCDMVTVARGNGIVGSTAACTDATPGLLGDTKHAAAGDWKHY